MAKTEPELIRAVKHERRSLLERYEIPVESLSYEYINECTDAKTLERIVLILRSGEEGVYPDLTKRAEERLAAIKPNSTLLRKAEPVVRRSMLDPDERKRIDREINSWTDEMQFREKDLEEARSALTGVPLPQPEIRQAKQEIPTKARTERRDKEKPKRISSCDYAAWDKYDADTELNKIEIREEQRRMELKSMQRKEKEPVEMEKAAASTTIDRSSLTGTELDVMAEQEREKGNEAFRAGDYGEALDRYSSSIKIVPNLAAYNNRAITLIKLQRYEEAVNDCDTVLRSEGSNVKALLRRALALEHLGKSTEALVDYEGALKLEPTNRAAINGVRKLRRPCEARKVRMTIEEVTDENEPKAVPSKKDNCKRESCRVKERSVCFCDRAPGPSRNTGPRPHLKADYCLDNEQSNSTVAKNERNNSTNERRNNKKQVLVQRPSNGEKVSFRPERLRAVTSPNKIQVADKYENKTSKPNRDSPVKIDKLRNPYEFVRVWQSLKDDTDLKVHAQLLRSMSNDDLSKIIGNKLDGKMLSTIVRCLERHFCTSEDARTVSDFLKSFSQVNRFSIVSMFLDAEDKRALRSIFNFLERQRSPDVSLLQEVYCIS